MTLVATRVSEHKVNAQRFVEENAAVMTETLVIYLQFTKVPL